MFTERTAHNVHRSFIHNCQMEKLWSSGQWNIFSAEIHELLSHEKTQRKIICIILGFGLIILSGFSNGK